MRQVLIVSSCIAVVALVAGAQARQAGRPSVSRAVPSADRSSDPPVARPDNRLTLGEFVVDPPTLINLGFEWLIEGDDNRNAAVEVSYRTVGEARWRAALPLLRLQGEHINNGLQLDVIAPNMFAGSVLDLEPDTAYDVRFSVSDPDGVVGQRVKTTTVRTRREPQPFASGRVFHVYPPGFKGQKIEPSFEGLMCAYNLTCSGTDWATAGRPRVKAGDTILVHAGLYKYNRLEYTNDPLVNRTVPLDGTYYLTADGTAERPIVISRGARLRNRAMPSESRSPRLDGASACSSSRIRISRSANR